MASSQGGDDLGLGAESSAQRSAATSISSLTSSASDSVDALNYWSLSKVRFHVLRAGVLWLAGFTEACQIHRAVSFCRRSRAVFIKTGQCFVLNGCIFLGSILVLQRIVIPILRWMLSSSLPMPGASEDSSEGDWKAVGMLQTVVVGVCYVFWLYPLYIISFVVNCIWYNDIARHAFQVLDKGGVSSQKVIPEIQMKNTGKGTTSGNSRTANQSSNGIQSIVLQIGEQIYSVIMVSAFFVEVFAVSYIPYVGQLMNFVLLSWLYAYYCFDYKWGFARWSLDRRLIFFETNWAFFAGFGSPCVLATIFFSPFVSAGAMNCLFPLFVLIATASDPEKVVLKCTSSHGDQRPKLTRLPIFYFANHLTLPILRLLQPAVSTTPSSIESRKNS